MKTPARLLYLADLNAAAAKPIAAIENTWRLTPMGNPLTNAAPPVVA